MSSTGSRNPRAVRIAALKLSRASASIPARSSEAPRASSSSARTWSSTAPDSSRAFKAAR